MIRRRILGTLALGVLIAGCAGFKGGWESVPYVGDAPPPLADAQTPYESRERARLRLDGLTIAVSIDNQVRTYDTQVYGYGVPLSVDPRTLRTQPGQSGRTRVRIEVSGMRGEFVFHPQLARLAVGDKAVLGIAGYEFAMWGAAGQRVSSGGRWEHRATGDRFALQDRSRAYLLSIDFPLEPPSPESRAISLDLSKALTAPGLPELPVIRFAPGRWKHGYT
ncbi:hypothetical protein [Quisquiliibacterium transsilvanicum]|uniref:Uncharacterized protein n=1 Tax=Quisquiliibacterium transsilvanicum TaxID=1549638 RepID=A0A7W8MAL0_9BURK|nr:hypothetical protein [Quisquiliibacterium transsilvanicum]MBB5273792.1 hypothetical protein [Quisquiliibacterium transsilvanicum]